MDEQSVKDVFTQGKAQDEADQRTRLGYMVSGAMKQRRAKEETLLANTEEAQQLRDEMKAIDEALAAAEGGDASGLETWFARRQSENCCAASPSGKNPDGNRFHGGGIGDAAVKIDVHR